jgi:hypothetical protein
MPVDTSKVADCVSGYAARLHAAIGPRHHVASALGAWLLLALVGPASSGGSRDTLTDVLGCDVDSAAEAAAGLLADPHPLVASAAAVWTAAGAELGAGFGPWRDQLPPEVTTGDLPSQADLDAWVSEHSLGLIDRFPIARRDDVYLVLASVLATKVSWQRPFDLAPAASLGPASPWASQLRQVLHTPTGPASGHTQFIASSPEAGDVIVHMARAAGGLSVVSVAAAPDVAYDRVLAAAYRIGVRLAAGLRVDRLSLADLPLGEGPLWLVREVAATADSCVAVLPAWSATSEHDLSAPALGFAAAKEALAGTTDPWQARQAAMARYSRTGFEAAAVSALVVALAMRQPGSYREAELRFGHPYAVVALTTAGSGAGSPWHGLPVFSAWVSEPDDATEDGPKA